MCNQIPNLNILFPSPSNTNNCQIAPALLVIVPETPAAWFSRTLALLLKRERVGFVHSVYALALPLNPLRWVLGAGLVGNQETSALQTWHKLGLVAGGQAEILLRFHPACAASGASAALPPMGAESPEAKLPKASSLSCCLSVCRSWAGAGISVHRKCRVLKLTFLPNGNKTDEFKLSRQRSV
ncbi:hypothetical protein KIL84_004630 [Mauremys mutica]|uniref:Uncharacterized protein n=1 Tax=Mauremys mutica TaxID=74926 RepID=A0A9D3XNF1_9SAUR|nr:hypothetical protein KIL84_004630 [Mauremys mutica]